jgi:hypothetical protein
MKPTSRHFLFIVLSFCFCSFQNLPRSPGEVVVFFNNCYYIIQETGTSKRVAVSEGVSNTQLYRTFSVARSATNARARQCVQHFLQKWQGRVELPSSDSTDYSANPTGEFALWLGKESCYNYIKKIFNVSTAASFPVVSSDWNFNWRMLRHSWSEDGRWLALAKEDKQSDQPHASTVLLVALSRDTVAHTIQVHPEEEIEEITWDSSSGKLAVLTCEWLRARTIGNLISPWAWFHPALVKNWYFYLVTPSEGVVTRAKIAHRTEYNMSYGVFWLK